ncbi:uncharacterized protein EKO05_0003128 [Ascochyta rabiei]|uniref:DUF7580 domain-containing protein n=1 Tax=Didymella rabiei TaxID=5454 RepID=A0A163BLM4_DIDRA|nr:uncharacterized protein EKO05_0003128 [Ascochyta rabiei]KZM21838.1 hypothetical protein ST47_g7014 [Ascochyta rabiei]UPX12584.1 hypothetical protein EKO05_0003128 [Ascochyta rabiei]
MSGIEIAGLVLGCLPLLIQGIESYNEGLDPIKSFMRWDKELPQCIRKLRNQHVHYSQTIRILLEPITADVELAEMMTDPGSSQLWKDKDMAMKLQDRLQESYHAYQGTIGDIERITKQIASKLDLDRANELKRNDLEALLAANPKKGHDKFELTKRIRFGMSKKTIKALLEELNDCNRELERFTEKSEKIETYRKAAKPSFATRLQRMQGYARNVHTSLRWSCSCKTTHRTSLRLEARGNLYASGMKTFNPNRTCFTVSFSSLAAGADVPWAWQAAEINIEEDDASLSPVSLPKARMTKSVSFSSPPPYSLSDPVADPSQSMQEVKDLCASIQQLQTTTSRIGLSLDTKKKLRGVYTIDASEKLTPPSDLVSLEDLLDRRPTVNGRRAKLSKKERYSLALTLASSVLYLNSTPWLTNQWAAKDIRFHPSSAISDLLDIEHPYLAPTAIEPVDSVTVKTKALTFQNKNTVLLALAVTLLELYFGTTAEKYQETEHGTCNPTLHQNSWLLCAMAHQWAEESQDELSAAFLNAVRHCLRCFSDPGVSLQDSDFLQAAAEGIVLPLQEELHQFLGKSC